MNIPLKYVNFTLQSFICSTGCFPLKYSLLSTFKPVVSQNGKELTFYVQLVDTAGKSHNIAVMISRRPANRTLLCCAVSAVAREMSISFRPKI